MQLENLKREAHAWFIVPEEIRDSTVLERFRQILSKEELERHHRFRFSADRHRHLVSHGMLREVLSCYLPVAPADWRFSYTKHGRPEIANKGLPQLRFNLTHTDGLTGCIVTLKDECGIDAERIVARHRPLDVARRMFSQVECEELGKLQGREQLEYFFSRWTLREAYVKAIGIGISFPTRTLRFSTPPRGEVRLEQETPANGFRGNFQFELLRPGDEHIAAVAVGGSDVYRREVITRHLGIEDFAGGQLDRRGH